MYRGTFGSVYWGFRKSDKRPVAIKVSKKDTVNGCTADKPGNNYRTEVATLEMVHNHSNVVTLHEQIETEQCYYIILQYANGGDLLSYLVKNYPLSEMDVKFIVFQVLSALEVSGCCSSSA